MWRILASKIRRGEYRGEHGAPGPEDSPLHDVTLNGSFPTDFYDSVQKAVQYYGDGTDLDSGSASIIFSCKGRPNRRVTVYRTVPKYINTQEKINKYEKEMKEILHRGKVPTTADYPNMDRSEYFDYAESQIQKLKSLPQTEPKVTINPGDWVTINKTYAIRHGQDNLRGQYRVLQKTVPASALYTDGNSLHEWGYSP